MADDVRVIREGSGDSSPGTAEAAASMTRRAEGNAGRAAKLDAALRATAVATGRKASGQGEDQAASVAGPAKPVRSRSQFDLFAPWSDD